MSTLSPPPARSPRRRIDVRPPRRRAAGLFPWPRRRSAPAAEGRVQRELARRELMRFLQLVEDLGPGLPMFSAFVDAERHRLLADPDAYRRLCRLAGTRCWAHRPRPDRGRVDWVGHYERRWGALPDAWFADASGRVDAAAHRRYRDSGVVEASWDCTPGRPRDVPVPG